MSEQTTEKTEFKPKPLEMTREDLMQKEHLVQTGATDTLPDGRTVAQVQESLVNIQKQQADDLRKRDEEKRKKGDKSAPETSYLSEKVEVVVHENGVMSASPVAEASTEPPPSSGEDSEPANDLPTDYPGRKAFLAAGITSLEKIASFDRDALLSIPGIKDATADKVLSYGKS